MVLKAKPDLVVSGINHGSNASINVIYSGTMAAVLEACIDGIPAIGYSLLDYSLDANFDHVDDYVIKIAKKSAGRKPARGRLSQCKFACHQR